VYTGVTVALGLILELVEEDPCSELVPILFVADVDPEARGVPEIYGLPVNDTTGLVD